MASIFCLFFTIGFLICTCVFTFHHLSFSCQIIEINLRGWNFKISLLSKEYQHTCKSTGLMLWESARLMASILAENPNIVAGKRVLELGCGSGGIFESSTNVFSCSGIYKICLQLGDSIVLTVHLDELVNCHLNIVSRVQSFFFFS